MTTATFYPKTKKAMFDAVCSGTLRVGLTKATYNAAHDFYDDVKSSTVGNLGSSTLANLAELVSPTTTGGVLDADDTVIQNVPADTYTGIVIVNDDSSADATSALVLFTDDAASGLPITTDGRDVKITWDSGAAKIGAL